MRGGVTYDQLLNQFSFDDRNFMYEVIKENIEATQKSGMPLI